MYRICNVKKDDYHGISSLLTQHYGKLPEFWKNRFKVWWDENPAFFSFSDQVRGWALKKGDDIVGFLGNIPTKFQFCGEIVEACNGTSWFVASEHRNHGIKLFFHLLRTPYSPVFITTPNETTLNIIKQLKIPLIPRGSDDGKKTVSGLPLVPMHQLSKDGWNIREADIEGLSREFLDKLSMGYHANKNQLSGIEQVTEAGVCFDDLWTRTKEIYQATNSRDADTINWLLANGNHKMTVFGYFKNKRLLGYIVVHENQKKGIIQCNDIWIYPEAGDIVDYFVNFLFYYGKEKGFKLLLFPHFNEKLGFYLKNLGLFTVDLGDRVDYLYMPKSLMAVTHENSYFCDLQGDYRIW
jgi:hypothetical protein